jgi:hypothetical protein
MKLMTWKDAIATLLTGAIIAVYAAFLSGTSLWLISSGRGATAAVLVLGMGAWALRPLDPGIGHRTALDFAGVATMISNIALLVAVIGLLTGSTVALTILVVGTAALWLITTIRRASGDSLPSITTLPSKRRRPAPVPTATVHEGYYHSMLEVPPSADSPAPDQADQDRPAS